MFNNRNKGKKSKLFSDNNLNLPNIITLSRIVLAIITTILLAIGAPLLLVGSLFCVSAFTDKIDGFLARKYNCITNLGKSGDALGDKILVTPILVVMALQGMIPLIIPYITFFRDSIVGIVKETASKNEGTVGASKLGKAKTATTMVGMAGILLGLPGILNIVSYALLYLGTSLCVISGVQYIYNYKDYLLDKNEEKSDYKTDEESDVKNEEKEVKEKSKEKEEYNFNELSIDKLPIIKSKPKVLTYGPKKFTRK